MDPHTPFLKIITAYSTIVHCDVDDVELFFHGQSVSPETKVAELDITCYDVLFIHSKLTPTAATTTTTTTTTTATPMFPTISTTPTTTTTTTSTPLSILSCSGSNDPLHTPPTTS